MVKNCHGFIPKKYRPKPLYYRQRKENWCAIFQDPQTLIHFEIEIFADFMDKFHTGKYLYLYKKVDGEKRQNLDSFTSIKSAMERMREEMDLPPEEFLDKSDAQFCDISKWTHGGLK